MKRTVSLLAAIASLLILSSSEQARARGLADEILAQVEETIEKAQNQADIVLRENAEREAGHEANTDGVPTGTVTLEVTGKPGMEFSGSCTVGEAENAIGGRTPQTYNYELDGRRLSCDIRNEGEGDLMIDFDAGNAHSEQSIGPRDGIVELVYDDGLFVASSSSGSSRQTVVQDSSSSR